MKAKRFFVIFTLNLCLIVSSICIAQSAGPERYWISFTQAVPDNPGAPGPVGPKNLMLIDSIGNVLIPSQKVVPQSVVRTNFHAPTALRRSGGRLTMWTVNRNETIIRVKIDKKSLKVISVQNIGIVVGNSMRLQVSQRDIDNFLVTDLASQLGVTPTGFHLNDKGAFTGEMTSLFRSEFDCFDGFDCGPSVSSDGKMAILGYKENKIATLLLQPLTSSGSPKRGSVVVLSGGKGLRAASLDITNPMSGSRFLVYVEAKFGAHQTLYLQVVSANTGTLIGSRIQIANGLATAGQSVAIDPLGRFVLYTVSNFPLIGTQLMFQALDATGHPSGNPKQIASKVDSGVDILKE